MTSRTLLLTGLGVVLALAVPFMLNGSESVIALRTVAPGLVAELAALAAISALAKAGKLQLLQRRLGTRPPFSRTLAVSLASDCGFLASPAGIGGYVVGVTLLRRAGVAWSGAMSVIAGEQALDLVFFAICLPLCAAYAAGPLLNAISMASPAVYAALAIVVAAMVMTWWQRKRCVAMCSVIFARWAWPRRVREFVSALRTQLVQMAHGDTAGNAVLMVLTTVQWTARYGALWVVLDALGQRLPLGLVMVLQAVILHLAQWTAIPGGGGSADLALAAVLNRWVAAPLLAVVLPLWRFGTFYAPLLLGALSFAVLARRNWKSA